MKRDKYDAIFSRLIRERDGWACQVCGKQYDRGAQGLHCSHFYSRRHQNTRYHPLNACAKCFGCHQRLGGDPVLFTKWVRKYLGEMLFGELGQMHNKIRKWAKGEKDEMHKHYAAELKRIEKLRDEGQEGVIEVVAWD